jgi:hypothetical protein
MSNDCVSTVGQDYYATAYVRVRAANETEAAAMLEAAFTMEEEHESVEGVFLTVCGGPWEGVEPVAEEDPCICPPEFIARNDGSFRGGCPVHGR